MKKHPTITLLESLNDALIYSIESAVCLAILYLLYHLFLRKSSPLQYNRAYLLIALLLSLSLPLIEFTYDPNQTLPVLNALNQFGREVSSEIIIEAEKAYSYTITATSQKPFLLWWEALILLYFIGVTFMGLRFLVRLRLIKEFIWYKRHVTRYKDRYFLVRTEGQMCNMSFLNYLFYDDSQNLSEEEKAQVIAHEKAHIDQKHSYDILFTELLKIFFWFNPLIYLYKDLISEVHEYLADQTAVRTSNVHNYTQLLIQTVLKKMGLDLASPFGKNAILKRVNRLKASHQSSWLNIFIPIPFVCALFFVFSFSEVETQKWEPQSIKVAAEIFKNASQLPEPEMGQNEWKKSLTQNMIMPKSPETELLQNPLNIRFKVDALGNLSGFRWVSNRSLPTEWIEREIIKRGKWKPAIVNGKTTTAEVLLSLVAIK